MENIVEEAAIAYNQKFTEDEYLNMEWENGQRYEYWDGELVAMARTTAFHNEIAMNTSSLFKKLLNTKGCRTFQESMMLKLATENCYFLPDVIVSCKSEEVQGNISSIAHPSIIVEVLSNSTELYDRTQKWDQYRKIRSLRHYLLVSQDQYRVEMYSRTNEHALFFVQIFDDLEAVIEFKDVGIFMKLKEIYEGISFQEIEITAK